MLNQMERPAEGAIGSNIVPFEFEGAAVRVVKIDGEPWFVARDIVEAVGAKWHHTAIRHIPNQWKGGDQITTPGGTQGAAIIAEQGVYFYLARSDKPKALPIQMWLAGEVLPSIRKTGGYGTPALDPSDPKQLLPLLIEHASKRLEAEHRLALAMADVHANDRIAKTGGSMCITDAAKVLQGRPCDLTAFMLGKKWGYRRHGKGRLVAHQDKLNAKLMEEKEAPYTRKDGTEGVSIQARITAKGLLQLAKEIEGAGMAPGIQLVSDQRELELRAGCKTAIPAPVAEPAPVKPRRDNRGRPRGSKSKWCEAGVCDWLSSQLADGPKSAREIRALAAEAGVGHKLLYAAARALNIDRIVNDPRSGLKDWHLPPKEDPIQTKGETSLNTEAAGQDQAQKKQEKPASWLSRLIGG